MGWASGGEYFDVVAESCKKMLEEGKISEEAVTEICDAIFSALRGGDWDTEQESLEEFADVAPIVAVFNRRGYVAYTQWAEEPGDLNSTEMTVSTALITCQECETPVPVYCNSRGHQYTAPHDYPPGFTDYRDRLRTGPCRYSKADPQSGYRFDDPF
jgi:hypothetical protein